MYELLSNELELISITMVFSSAKNMTITHKFTYTETRGSNKKRENKEERSQTEKKSNRIKQRNHQYTDNTDKNMT